jgi:hypothetical protein
MELGEAFVITIFIGSLPSSEKRGMTSLVTTMTEPMLQ